MRNITRVLVWALPLVSFAETLRIENERLAVRYDVAAGVFTLAEKPDGRTFAAEGRIEGVAESALVEEGQDPVFGAGERIAIRQPDGSTASLELYRDLPFVLIRGKRHNGGTNAITVARCVPATFTLDLAKPASNLCTMGTAGLLPPDQNPGSYVFLTCADPATRRGVVAGWVTHDRGDGVLFSEVKEGKVGFKGQIDYGRLLIEPGQSALLETLAVGVFDDARIGQELFADAIKKYYGIQLRARSPGFCTWYSEVGGLTDKKGGAGALNEKDIVTLTEFAAKELKPFGFGFVQIDDEWQDGASNPDGSRINGPRRGFTRHKPDGPYPSGMAATAAMIASNGLTAGIWILPFARNHQDPEYKDRQDWFMKRLDGKPYETVWGGTSLDLTQRGVQAHLVELAETLKGWGFDYFKMDGLWTGSATEQVYVNDGYKDDQIGNNAPFSDPRVTNIEAMRNGLKLLRQAAGPKVYFSGCCASQNMRSLGGVMGLVDSMRVGPDNGFEWQDYRKEVMHFEGGGIITGPIRANRLYFLHGRVWWNDPDPAYVRPAVKLNHAQLLASWIAVAGAFNLNSDWLPGLPPERLDILKRCMPSHHAQARPVDYFDTTMPSIWLLTDGGSSIRRDVLGLYNWESEARAIAYDARKAGLDGGRTHHAFDFWGNVPLPDFSDAIRIDVPGESCRIVAVRAAEGRPVLVSTSRHVTQGIVDVKEETWDGSTLSGASDVVANDPYELRMAGIQEGGGWTFMAARVSPEDEQAGVTISTLPAGPGEEGWLRLVIRGNTSNRLVRWSASFVGKGDTPDPSWRTLGEADFVNVNGASNTWTWTEAGVHCSGQPVGVIRSRQAFTNFELVAEWRHLKPGGNSGIFVWGIEDSLKDLAPGKLPQGIEVQILDNDFTAQYERRSGKKGDWFTTHGDVFAVGAAKLKPFAPTSPNGSRSFPRRNLSRSSPEWNHYRILAVDGEVRLWVNGEEVSGGSGAEPRSGYLCLESEGSPVEFRNLRLRELP